MNLIQLIQDGTEYGLFTTNIDRDLTELINLCKSRAESLYEDDLDEVLELHELFIEQLELEGICRVFTTEYNI